MMRKAVGGMIVGVILASTLLAVLGIWGLVEGNTVWQLLGTLLATGFGLGVAGEVADKYFFRGKE
jgi:hypothetical protein